MPPRDPDERELDAVRDDRGPVGDDLDALRRLGRVARALTGEDAVLDEPPPGLWDRIHVTVHEATATMPGEHPAGQPHPPGVASLAAARRRRRGAWLLAAAAVVVLVAGAVSLIVAPADDDTVLASARLEPLADTSPATAELVESDDGLELDMRLATSDLPPTQGFYEVWLIDREVERLISLGPVRPDATYTVPADIDYHDFPIVDVSVEPPDGDPAHSGDSILRGTLA